MFIGVYNAMICTLYYLNIFSPVMRLFVKFCKYICLPDHLIVFSIRNDLNSLLCNEIVLLDFVCEVGTDATYSTSCPKLWSYEMLYLFFNIIYLHQQEYKI